METLVIIIAFWLILVGAYGVLSIWRTPSAQARERASVAARLDATARPAGRAKAAGSPAATDPKSNVGGLYSEVDLLRAQVEHLRTEVVALSGVAEERPVRLPRRSRAGTAADLPGPLRRQVRARNARPPLQA